MTARRFAVRPGWLVALAALAWLGFTLGLRHLALPDEGRYAGVAWEMLRSGDWLVPRLDGLPFLHKPPLFYWITGASLWLFGPSNWAARVAPLLGAVLAIVSLHWLLRRWIDDRVARWAAIILATQPMCFGGAQFANLDMLVGGCIGATIALAADAALRLSAGDDRYRTPLIAAHAMAALGVLAKGLIGIVLPVAIIVSWLLLWRRARLIPKLVSLPGWLLFAAIAAPWFIAVQQQLDGFAHYFFVYQHFHRYALSGFNNTQPVWFFVAGIALLTLPWFPGLWAAWQARALDDSDARRALRLLMWVWLIGVIVFFSIPRSKLIGYVAAALPPLAALIADGIWRLSRDTKRTEHRLRAVAVLAALVCVTGITYVRLTDTRTTESLARLMVERRMPGDAVIFVNAYYYDVPLLARLTEPVQVVEAWNAADIAARDNWRKELVDAARFAPQQAHEVLVNRGDFARLLCQRPVSWVFALPSAAARYPALSAAAPIASTQRAALWRLDNSACISPGETPIAGWQSR